MIVIHNGSILNDNGVILSGNKTGGALNSAHSGLVPMMQPGNPNFGRLLVPTLNAHTNIMPARHSTVHTQHTSLGKGINFRNKEKTRSNIKFIK